MRKPTVFSEHANISNISVADFHADFNRYLQGLEFTSLTDFEALRDFKIDEKTQVAWPPSK